MYAAHVRASLKAACGALERFVGEWDLQMTEGGYERGILGEWSDTP